MTNNHANTKKADETTDTLYFDSECAICSAEMAKLDRLKADSLTLQPIADAQLDDAEREAFYQNLHVRKANGEILRGFDANIYVWSQTKYAPFAKLFSVPPLVWFGRLGYALWLRYYQYQRKKRLKTTNKNL